MANKNLQVNTEKAMSTNYGTKVENVVKETSQNISVFGDQFLDDKIVIAKDIDDSLYVTVKSLVGSGLLDPFKCYQKPNFTVKEEQTDNGPVFHVKYKDFDPGIVL